MKIACITLFLLLFMGCFSYVSAYDIRPLEVFIKSPEENTYFSGDIPFQTEVHAHQPIYKVTIYFNETSWQDMEQRSGTLCEGVFTYTWQSQFVPDGSYNVTIKAMDTYGNYKTEVLSVNIDNTPPELILCDPFSELNFKLSGEYQLLTVSATDTIGVELVKFKVDEGTWENMTYYSSLKLYATTLNTTKYTNGNHNITFKAVDRAGNTKNATYEVEISNQQKIHQPTAISTSTYLSSQKNLTVSTSSSGPSLGNTSSTTNSNTSEEVYKSSTETSSNQSLNLDGAPGDNTASAIEITEGATIGSLPGPSVDNGIWYKIFISNGETIEAYLWGPSGTDFDMEFYDIDGSTLLNGAWDTSYPDLFSYTVSADGYYFIHVYPFSGSGSFTLDITTPIQGDDPVTAVEITEGTTIGSLPGPSIDDGIWYTINLYSGDTFGASLTGPSGTDFDMEFYDTDGSTLLDGAWDMSYPDIFLYTVSADGYYFIHVYPFSGSGSFTLEITLGLQFIVRWTEDDTYILVEATYQGLTSDGHFEVYTDDSLSISSTFINEVKSALEQSWAQLVPILGTLYDEDGDGRIEVLLTDIGDTSGVAGYVFRNDPNDLGLIYWDSDHADMNDFDRFGLSHEFTHRIQYNYDIYEPSSGKFIFEGIAEWGGDYAWSLIGGYHISSFLNSPDVSLADYWEGGRAYGCAYLFFEWLSENYGVSSSEIIRDVLESIMIYDGREAVSQAVGVPFDILFRNWIIDTYLDNYSPENYMNIYNFISSTTPSLTDLITFLSFTASQQSVNDQVKPWASDYIRINPPASGTGSITIDFNGADGENFEVIILTINNGFWSSTILNLESTTNIGSFTIHNAQDYSEIVVLVTRHSASSSDSVSYSMSATPATIIVSTPTVSYSSNALTIDINDVTAICSNPDHASLDDNEAIAPIYTVYTSGGVPTSVTGSLTWTGSEWQALNVDVSGLEAGDYYVIIYFEDTDAYGTSSHTTGDTSEFTIQINILSPSSSSYVRDTVIIDGSVFYPLLNTVWIEISSQTTTIVNQILTSPYDYSWDTVSVENGIHSITLFANNILGNTISRSITVTVDNTPPTVETTTLQQSTTDPTDQDSVTISVDVADNFGIGNVILSYSIDDGFTWNDVQMLPSSPTYSGTIPSQSAGTTVLYYITVEDMAGNQVVTDQYSYTVESSDGNGGGGDGGGGDGDGGENGGGDDGVTSNNLIITILSEIARSVMPGTSVNVTLRVTDNSGENIEDASVTINVGNVTTLVCEYIGDGIYQGFIDTSNLSPGSYLIVISVKKSGYTETSTSFTLTVQSTSLGPPMVGIFGIIGAFAIIVVIVSLKKTLLSKQAISFEKMRPYHKRRKFKQKTNRDIKFFQFFVQFFF